MCTSNDASSSNVTVEWLLIIKDGSQHIFFCISVCMIITFNSKQSLTFCQIVISDSAGGGGGCCHAAAALRLTL